ncbi:hypothetical protein ACP4OV_015992 [Aristida adscensionis]
MNGFQFPELGTPDARAAARWAPAASPRTPAAGLRTPAASAASENAGAWRGKASGLSRRRVPLGDLSNLGGGGGGGRTGNTAATEHGLNGGRKFKASLLDVQTLPRNLLEEQRCREWTEMEPATQDINEDMTLKNGLSSLSGTNKVIMELGSIIEQMSELIGQQSNELRMMSERLSDKEEKVKSLEQEGDRLRSQVAFLESKLVHGDCSASSTEVPHMVNTSAANSEAKLELKKTEECLLAAEELKGQAGIVSGSVNKEAVIEISDDEDILSIWHDDDKPSVNANLSGRNEPGLVKKQTVIEVSSDDEDIYDEDISMCYDDCKNSSLKSNFSGCSKPGDELWHQRGSYGWFFIGNKLLLSSGMKNRLNALKELGGSMPPEIPFFIYQMNKSNVQETGRMRFSAKYTRKHLVSCLKNGEGYAHFQVDGKDRGTVLMKLSSDGCAYLTSGWENVVTAKGIEFGDICAFHFKVSHGVLKLCVYVFHVDSCVICER